MRLKGSFVALVLFDVAEQIELDRLREIVGAAPPRREPSFRHPVPEYVRFERPPVVEDADLVEPSTGEKFQCHIKYYDYGVVCVVMELPFESDWDGLLKLSSYWINSPELEVCAAEALGRRLGKIQKALTDPYEQRLSEDYYIVHIQDANSIAAPALLAEHGGEIAQIVRGESSPLSESERAEILQSSMSYYPSDLLVAGWTAALVYDTAEGAAPTMQLLEYANTQLLEFRHYDNLLTSVLERVYDAVEEKRSWFTRWRMARQAHELNALRLDVTELTERTDNAIKFLSEMFYARMYRMAALKVGVPDYRTLVERKLRIAGELYEFMMNQYHQARSFALEVAVVVILIIELLRLVGK